MVDRIKMRRDTAANWTTYNPVLGDGELGFERDTGRSKLGDGVTAWALLAYQGTYDRAREHHTGEQPIASVTGLQSALDDKELAANKGVAGGYAGLDGSGKVPSAQLPSYVDDVLEAANFAALPGTGEGGKIYVTVDTGKTWRWSGSAYVEISQPPASTDAVPEGAGNLYFTHQRVRDTVLTGLSTATNAVISAADSGLGALGKLQAQITGHTDDIANPHGVSKTQVGLGSVDNTSDATKNAATATLTNKTVNLSSNTLSGTKAQFNTALSDADFLTTADLVTVAQGGTGAATLTGLVKGNGTGAMTAAVAGTDYTSPAGVEPLSNKVITGSTASLTAIELASVSQALHSGAIVKLVVYDTSRDSDGGAWRKRCQHTSWYTEALGFTGKWLGQKSSTATAWATVGAVAGDGFQNTTDGKYYVLTGTSTASEIFRGNVREFPAVACIVVDSTGVIVYDLTQPTFPMWMVFAALPGIVAYTPTISCVAAKDGLLVAGGSNGLLRFNLVSDAMRFTQGGNDRVQNLISSRTTQALVALQNPIFLVNNVVNDVAITVLDTAPIDPATGLPVPTIACATGGGISVIKDDGAVVNSAAAYAFTNLRYVRNALWASHSAGSDCFYFPSPSTASFASLYGVYASSIPSVRTISVSNKLTQAAGGVDAFGGSGGMALLRANPAAVVKGMAAAVTNTYSSGWLPGDIRGAYLADTTAETLSGSGELVTNGTFATDTSGWTTGNSATFVQSGGAAVLTNGAAASGYAYQTITTIAGKTYFVSGTLTLGTAPAPRLQVGTSVSGSDLGVQQLTASGAYGFSFVAAGTTTYLTLQNNTTTINLTTTIDNISVKLADPDRSVKNKGLVVNGSLTKAAVASGAGLVAYSGFSASNYLEQPYNSDLDFGTGDFCVMGWESLAAVTDQVIRIARGTVGGSRVGPYSASTGTYYISMLGAGGINSGVSQTLGWNFIAWVRESGVLKLYLNSAMVFSVANTTNLTDAGAILRVGTDNAVSPAWLGPQKMALWRISATAPSADQISHIYRTELPLFQANAQCTLAGTSTAVTALAYDDATELLHVGTSWGRTSFHDLTRVDSEATTTGSITSLFSQGGVVLTGGTSGKVYMPALLLRNELKRKEEARRALGRTPVFFDHTATASQTAFVAPKGYTVKALYKNGTLMREATTGVYWKRSFDGFVETATLSVGASASDWISLMCVGA